MASHKSGCTLLLQLNYIHWIYNYSCVCSAWDCCKSRTHKMSMLSWKCLGYWWSFNRNSNKKVTASLYVARFASAYASNFTNGHYFRFMTQMQPIDILWCWHKHNAVDTYSRYNITFNTNSLSIGTQQIGRISGRMCSNLLWREL